MPLKKGEQELSSDLNNGWKGSYIMTGRAPIAVYNAWLKCPWETDGKSRRKHAIMAARQMTNHPCGRGGMFRHKSNFSAVSLKTEMLQLRRRYLHLLS